MIILQIFRTKFCLFKLIFTTKKQMMLYQRQPQQGLANTTSTIDKKRNKYRTQIRKNYLKKHFNQIRTKMMDDLKSQSFIDILKCLDSKFNQEEFNNLISIIEGQCDNYEFNKKMAEEKVEQILVSVILNNSQNIETRENRRLISALSYLTYYSTSSIACLISRFDFIQHLRKTLQILNMKQEENISYFKQIIILLMNITSALKRDFNLYIAQSDICYSILRQIGSTKQFITQQDSSYNKSVHQAREYILKMLRNVFINLKDRGRFSSRLAAQILQDACYISQHLARTFILLSEGMNNQKFWSSLLQKEVNFNFTSLLTDSMFDLQERCLSKQYLNNKDSKLTDKEIEHFYGMLEFLNSLYNQGQQQEISWDRMIESSLNGFMLADFLFEALRRQNDQHIKTALLTYINLSNTIDVTGDQLIIVRPALEQLQFLKVILDLKVMGNHKYGKLCLIILRKLLLKDEKFVQILVLMKIIDNLADIIACSGQISDLLINCIQVCIQLIMVDRKIGKDNKVYELMMEKGFTKLMENYQDTSNRDLEIKVDMLVDLFAEEKEAK